MESLYNLSPDVINHAKIVFMNEYNRTHNNETFAVTKKINQIKARNQLFEKQSNELEKWLLEHGYLGVPVARNIIESYQRMIKDITAATDFIDKYRPILISQSDLDTLLSGFKEFDQELEKFMKMVLKIEKNQLNK